MGVWYDMRCGQPRDTGTQDEVKTTVVPGPTRILGVDVAPLNVPWERRLQTLGVLHYLGCFLVLGFGSLFFCLYVLLATSYWWLVLLYAAWYIYDRPTYSRGGRRIPWVRKMRAWTWLRDYFPISLVKTAELPPNKNYLIGYHPHGIFSTGAFCNFATDATDFHGTFPGLRPILLTLGGQYDFPLFREYFGTSGSCSCSKDSLEWLLTKEGTGNAIVLVVGGASEVLECRAGSFTLVAKSRKGFIKMAMKHGTSLVPCFSFGENELYEQTPNPPGSFVRKVQEKLRSVCGFASPLFQGRGIFQYTFGIVPRRTPINTVVGSPIDVIKNENPSNEEIDAVHKQYFDDLHELFEENKGKYGVSNDVHLNYI